MGRKSKARMQAKRHARENAQAMNGLERLANMTDDEAAAYVRELKIREARAVNNGAPVGNVCTGWKLKQGRRA